MAVDDVNKSVLLFRFAAPIQEQSSFQPPSRMISSDQQLCSVKEAGFLSSAIAIPMGYNGTDLIFSIVFDRLFPLLSKS